MTLTGLGLNILICTDYVPHHDWMSFLCWYSISKNAPDAQVSIKCNRQLMQYKLFNWTKRCKVPFDLHKPLSKEEQVKEAMKSGFVKEPLFVLEPDLVWVREFSDENKLKDWEGKNLISDKIWLINDCDSFFNGKTEELENMWSEAKSDEITHFASIDKGCGKFVMESWINKFSAPFSMKIIKGDATPNEIKIGKLWDSLVPLYRAVNF
jgi:hypothetical protein